MNLPGHAQVVVIGGASTLYHLSQLRGADQTHTVSASW